MVKYSELYKCCTPMPNLMLNMVIKYLIQASGVMLVSPVLLYGCDIWGFENIDNIKSLHVKFCKAVVKLAEHTPNCLGRAWET